MSLNKIIIFCQAPADIPYTLELHEQFKHVSSISIFVINGEGMYKFLLGLCLDLDQLVFIPYKVNNLKKYLSLYAERKRINNLWDKYFSNLDNGEVYFFSRFEDWLTSAFLHRFAKKRGIYIKYADHYDDVAVLYKRKKKKSFSMRGFSLILRYLTNAKFKVEIIEKLPEFSVDSYPIEKISIPYNSEIIFKHSFKIPQNKGDVPMSLFLTSTCDELTFESDMYNNTHRMILKFLRRKNCNVIIKGHPRYGIPDDFKKLSYSEIPSYIPGEFIDVSQFSLCLGLNTVALANLSKNTTLATYSLMEMFIFKNDHQMEIYKQYLKQQSDERIRFCDSFDLLEEVVTEHCFNFRMP